MRPIVCCLVIVWACALDSCVAIGSGNRTVVLSIEKDCDSVAPTTTLERSFQNILSRQKRWFVFPKGANVAIQLSVTKSILGVAPSGLRMVNEVTLAYDIPPWLEGWKAISIWGVTPKAPPVATTPKTPVVEPPKPKLTHRMDYHPVNYVWKYPNWAGYSRRRKGQSATSLTSQQRPAARRRTFFHDKHFPATFDHHREYRERRQIFEKLESLGQRLGFSGKACVLRAICEVNNNLLPEGMSFIQDVSRIIFSLPIDQEIDDEYMHGARREPMNCAREFASSCPFNPIVYFLKNTQGSLEKWSESQR